MIYEVPGIHLVACFLDIYAHLVRMTYVLYNMIPDTWGVAVGWGPQFCYCINTSIRDLCYGIALDHLLAGCVFTKRPSTSVRPRRLTLDAKVLQAKVSLNWASPYKVVAVGLCSSRDPPYGSPLGAKLLNFFIICLPACPAQTLAGACRCNSASPVSTPTTVATSCRSVFQRG